MGFVFILTGMVQLIVEGIILDLSEDMSADITYSLADIRTPDKRQVNYTKTLTLNGTALNNSAFGYIFDVDVSNEVNASLPNIGINYNPKKLAKAKVLSNSVEIFDGALRLWKVTQNKGVLSYEVSLFGKLYDIFSLMGDSKLTDLSYSNLDHNITWANIQSNWIEASPGFRYPLVDFGYNEQDVDGRPSSLKFGSLIPSIYYKVYIDKIFSSIGASYILNFSNLDILNKLLVVPSIPKIAVRPFYIRTSLANQSPWYYNDGDINLTIHYDYVPIVSTVEEIVTGLEYSTVANQLTFTDPIESSFQLKISAIFQRYLSPTGNEGGGGISVVLYDEFGTQVAGLASATAIVTDSPDVQQFTIEIPRRLYQAGQHIAVSVDLEPFTQATIMPGAELKGVSPTDQTEYPIPSGYVYEMINSVPLEIKQQDFIKDFIKIFNLFVTQDPNDPTIFIFTPQVDFYSRVKANAIDWTAKIDYDAEIEITPINQLSAKEYLLTWKQDKDYWCTLYEANNKQIYGQTRIVSDTDIISNVEKVESIFSPGVLVRFQNSSVVCPSIYKVETIEGVETKKPDKFNARLMLWGGLLAAGHNIDLLDVAGNPEFTVAHYPYAGHLDNPVTPALDINFSSTLTDLPVSPENLYIRYWFKSLFESFNKDGKLIACKMLLKDSDIQGLDFAALYKVALQYYRLNLIKGYNPFEKSTCNVELIKVVTL